MDNLLCKLIGHKYVKKTGSLKHLSDYECKNCKEKFTKDGYGIIVKLTPFWEENNSLIEQYTKEGITQF